MGEPVPVSSDRLAEIEARLNAAIEGPWYTDSYGSIFSSPRTKAWMAVEDLIPEDAPEEDPRWEACTKLEDASHVAYMAKGSGVASERFIAHSHEDVTWLIAEVKRLSAVSR